MSKPERIALIKQIQDERQSHLITYVTSTRPNLEVEMAMDSIRRVYDHLVPLKGMDPKPKIDLFIYSNGGDGTVPWRLVTLIREFTDDFSVLVPFRAFSAATLTCLGADHIVMHPMGMLGPTDPTVSNPFNPPNPANPQKRIGISVEDVSAYIALIKEDAGITHEDELIQAISILATHVHPLALGNVKRSISQSRMMAQKLLSLHMNLAADEHKISEIVDKLTSKLFYHGHPINRKEARDHLGIPTIEEPSSNLESAMWDLYLQYESEILIDQPFNPGLEFSNAFPALAPGSSAVTPSKQLPIVFVESEHRTDAVTIDYQLKGARQPDGNLNVEMVVTREGWVQI